jgi:hypothetical protein
MTRLGLRPPFALGQIADLAFWYRACGPQCTLTGGAIEHAFDPLAASDQLALIDWTSAKCGV